MHLSRLSLMAAVCAGAVLAGCGGAGQGGYYGQMTRDQQRAAARDADTAARVKAAIMADVRITGRTSIQVSVTDGVAELQGQANSVEERLMVNDIARRTPGVRQVLNNLVMN